MATAQTKSYAKFCSFCFHSKRPEEEFSSHWVKDKEGGAVTCPLLLANVCGYCKGKGHTPKFCPRLKSRNARRKAHEQRMRGRGAEVSPVRGMDKLQSQIRQKEADATAQKRARARCNDNQYATLMGAQERDTKRVKTRKTKPAPVWNGPKVTPPRAAQGVWGKAKATADTVKDMTADEVAQLKLYLANMNFFDDTPSAAEQEFLDAQIAKTSQTLEETAEGEAFFDNVADTEDSVVALAATEQPALERQGAFGTASPSEAPLPVPGNPPAIALPEDCDMDADFGEAGDDGWCS